MTTNEILTVLKTDLEISTSLRDDYLKNLITLAENSIKKEGIKLFNGTVEEGMLVEMYAAHLYRQRRGGSAALPRHLRFALNNMLMSQKGKVNNG